MLIYAQKVEAPRKDYDPKVLSYLVNKFPFQKEGLQSVIQEEK